MFLNLKPQIMCWLTKFGFFLSLFFVLNTQTVHATSNIKSETDLLLAFFDKIVFGREFDTGIKNARINKWVQPLRVVMRSFDETIITQKSGNEIRKLHQKPIPQKYSRLVKKHIAQLTKQTGLRFEDAKLLNKPANIVINFVPELQLANSNLANVNKRLLSKLAGQGGCYFLSFTGGNDGQIVKAIIVVNRDRLIAKTDHCLLEELTQSMGLPNDIDAPWPSIFNNTGRLNTLSRQDRIFIRTLYDPRLTKGMGRKQALPIARKIISEQLVGAD